MGWPYHIHPMFRTMAPLSKLLTLIGAPKWIDCSPGDPSPPGFWLAGCLNIPGLVNVYITMENHHAINGKTHYKWSFSIAMLNYQRVFDISGKGVQETIVIGFHRVKLHALGEQQFNPSPLTFARNWYGSVELDGLETYQLHSHQLRVVGLSRLTNYEPVWILCACESMTLCRQHGQHPKVPKVQGNRSKLRHTSRLRSLMKSSISCDFTLW